jgi:hypothetical protein
VERDVSLTSIAIALLVGAIALATPFPAHAAEPKLVLVASAKSPVAPISAAEARRLYLGVPLIQDGHEVEPLRNAADPGIQELFLQRVLFMSAQAYERQMSGRVYRSGGNRIPEYADQRALFDKLQSQPWSVTYMSLDAAAGQPNLKIVSPP